MAETKEKIAETKEKKAPAAEAKGKPESDARSKGKPKGKGKDKRGDGVQVQGEHAGASLPIPAPRLKGHYEGVVRERLMKQFGFENPHQVPTVSKIVLNCGVGEAVKNAKMLENIVSELAIITGQRPVRRKAKKSISNFGLRQGQEIGASVTLRGARMWEFLDRLITVAIPRIRDFRGLNTRGFDGRGNYTVGIKEQMIFPEINYDMVEQIHGMDITFVTTTNRDDVAIALLRSLGMPFKGEAPGSAAA